MKKSAKLMALVLAVVMCLGVLTACGSAPAAPAAPAEAPAESTTEPAAPAEEAAPATDPNTPLVVGYSAFNSKFSPFFATTAYDQDAQGMTQLSLLPTDRTGSVLLNAGTKEGETVAYDGVDYTYYGVANCVITENEDGTVYYDITMRDDIKFSDGEPMTIDDVIFNMYALLDPTYDGSSTLYALPILGLDAYMSGMDSRGNAIFAAGEDNTDFTLWSEEQQTAFWDFYNNEAGAAFAKEICDYCIANGYNAPDDSVAACAINWGYELADDATYYDFWNEIVAAYPTVDEAVSVETAGSDLLMLTIAALGSEYQAGVTTGESAPNVEGIQKTGDYSLRLILTEVDATAIYQLGLAVAPLHYYGDTALYDYENNMFGFPKGDLSSLRAKTTQPLGAGPYKFIKFENGVIYYEANENYYKGCPKTKYVNFQECTADQDKLNGVLTGTIDIADPSFSNDVIDAIESANGGSLIGDVVTTNLVDNLGYGYIGIAASRVNVGGENGSEASKNLRRALATVLAVYRDVAVDSYYGELASVINYPISNTSWAAPQPSDDGYQIAFSVDVNGDPIYTSSMSAEDKYAAALEAALGFFEAAGYTVEDGKLTAAPEGAALEYEVWIPGDGIGDHPSFMVLTEAHDALATIGFNLIIRDLANSSDLWDALDADEADMWAAAWGAALDPDMYQVYHSSNVVGLPGSTNSNHYFLQDAELDEMMVDARASTDQAYRKVMYKACLDKIIEWAVEIPVYQRQNAMIFSTERVNIESVPNITTFYYWWYDIENVTLK